MLVERESNPLKYGWDKVASAPLGRKKNESKPTGRGKTEVKRCLRFGHRVSKSTLSFHGVLLNAEG